MSQENRATFGGRIGAVLVAAGSAVGLGNIWRFPYIVGENGGGAFLLVYLCCIMLLGLPLMISEFSIGASTHKNAVGAFRELNKRWTVVGYLGVLASLLILSFYLVVAGWTAEYTLHSFLANDVVRSTSVEVQTAAFNSFITHPWKPLIYAVGFSLATHIIIVLGVQKGIERASKLLMPMLFVFLFVLACRSMMMPRGLEGLQFFLTPDFSKLTTSSVLAALGQAFFSLSIGLGTMVTYGSYFKSTTHVQGTAVRVSLLDTFVAIMAGLVIFPAVFSAGIEPGAGPSLVFITLPSIFATMPWPALWSSLFFLLLVVAALTSTISMHEAGTAYMEEEYGLSRRKAAWCVTLFVSLLCCFCSLSLGAWSWLKVCGLSLFDAFDYLTANIMLPLGGLLTCLFTGWFFERKRFESQLYPEGKIGRLYPVLRLLIRYICPIIIVILFADNLGII
ncbi:MAG: sodium-dependent transporter [Rikenellaceae bacterium]|nr:sodium-dependent transporter [Rikenellaceae bacterium]